MDKLNDRIKNLIEEAGLNPHSLSLNSGLDETTVRKLLAGKVKSPTVSTLCKISKALKLYPSEVLPIEWQSPGNTLNKKALAQAVNEILELTKNIGLQKEQIADLIVEKYIQISSTKSKVTAKISRSKS